MKPEYEMQGCYIDDGDVIAVHGESEAEFFAVYERAPRTEGGPPIAAWLADFRDKVDAEAFLQMKRDHVCSE